MACHLPPVALLILRRFSSAAIAVSEAFLVGIGAKIGADEGYLFSHQARHEMHCAAAKACRNFGVRRMSSLLALSTSMNSSMMVNVLLLGFPSRPRF
jgi:hypothetical protein